MQSNSFIATVLQGGIFSLVILGILLCMSIISWAIIGQKFSSLNSARKLARQFLSNVNTKAGINDILSGIEYFSSSYYAAEFYAAYGEYQTQLKTGIDTISFSEKQDLLTRIERAIEQNTVDQGISFEKGIPVLATISSSSPFIGLFGTVAGIIEAFFSIGSQGAASIAVVAPGISTALVATAFGLFAAIPALIGFNLLRNKIQIIKQEMESFGYELLNLFDREFTLIRKPQAKPVPKPMTPKVN